ncbi:MAG: type II secretion system protein GspM [Smithella sp.]
MEKKNRILIIAIPFIVILLGAVIYEYGYLRVQSELSNLRETVASRSRILAKYRAVIADKPRLEQTLASEKEIRKAENSRLIEGQTLSVAAASLQSVIKETITSRGGSIASERVERAETTGKFRIVSVIVDAIIPDTKALTETLYAIETQTTYLVIRELDIRIRNFNNPRDLTVRLKVSGLTGGG